MSVDPMPLYYIPMHPMTMRHMRVHQYPNTNTGTPIPVHPIPVYPIPVHQITVYPIPVHPIPVNPSHPPRQAHHIPRVPFVSVCHLAERCRAFID